MTWYKVTLTVEQFHNDKQGEIEDKFARLTLQMGRSKEVALFRGGFSENDGLNFYFTPRCGEIPMFKALIDSYGGIPCDKPTREVENELGISNGDMIAWKDMRWCPDL